MDKREPLLYIAVGKKGVGKSYNTTRIIDDYVRGDVINGVPPRKVLIIDINNEYQQYKRMYIRDIVRFANHPKIEVRRITPFSDTGRVLSINEVEDVFKRVSSNFRNGLILAEDITRFVGDSIPDEIVGNMCTNRHRDVDIIAHFQAIGKAGHPKLKANMNILRYHKCLDSVERHKDKFKEYTEILKLAEKLVNNRYDQFMKNNRERSQTYFDFFVYVDFDRNTIDGQFSKEEFKGVITDYVQENEKSTIQPLLSKKDRKGNKLFTYEQALTTKENEIFERYAPTRFNP